MDELLLAQSGDPDDPPPKLLPLLSAPYRIARPAGSLPEYAWQWIVREGEAGQIQARGRTWDGQEPWLFPNAWGRIDRATSTLRSPFPKEIRKRRRKRLEDLERSKDTLGLLSLYRGWPEELTATEQVIAARIAGEVSPEERGRMVAELSAACSCDEEIRHIKLCVDDLMRLGMRPPPDAKVVELGRMRASEILSWLALRRWLKFEDGEWPTEMGRELLPAQRELTRAWRKGLLRLRDSRGELVPDMNDRDVILTPYGTLDVSPPRAPDKFPDELKAWRGITVEGEIARLYPVLISAAEWIHKAVERYAAAGTTGAEPANLNALVEFEANRPHWACFKERTKSIGGNLDNSVLEETARALLASDLSAAWVPEIQPALREMQEIKRRMVDRLVEAVHTGQLEITGYHASDLTVVTIPARLVTADQILSLLRSGELPIFGRHYVGVQIGPPKPPEASSEPQHNRSQSARSPGGDRPVTEPEAASSPPVEAVTPPPPPPPRESATKTDLISRELTAMFYDHFKSEYLLQDLIEHLLAAVQPDKDAAVLPRVELLKLIYKVIADAARADHYELVGRPDDPSGPGRTISPATLPSFLPDEWDHSRLIVDGSSTVWHSVTVWRTVAEDGNSVWDWWGLKRHLQSRKLNFLNKPDALVYYRKTVQRINGEEAGEGPDPKAVREAAKRHHLHHYVTISRPDSA
jgi:hypothetical protein